MNATLPFSLSVCLVLALACGSGDDGSDGAAGSGGSSGSGASGGSAGSSATGGSAGNAGASGSSGAAGTGNPAGGEIGPGATECQLPAPPSGVVCEATGGARCYYIDADAGDDVSGDGSFASPWRTLANIVTYYGTPGEGGSTPKPSTAIDLAPGDVVYLFGGSYGDVYNYSGYEQVARFRNVNGIRLRAYPGETPVIEPASDADGIVISQSSDVEISGIEIRGAWGSGLQISETENARVSHVRIVDTDGVDNDNIAGLYIVGSESVEVACSELYDNFDRQNADTQGQATENSSNLVVFGGGNLRIHHNRIFQSPAPSADKTGGCIKYKHAASSSEGTFEVDHNLISSCKFFGIGSGTQHTHVHHNVVHDGSGLVSRDYGGTTHQTDQVFEYNTLYLAGGFSLSPTDAWSDENFDDPENIVFSHNIVVHDLSSASQEHATVVIGTYASDALYDKTVPELVFAKNCYFNPSGEPSFALFAANGGNYGSKGDLYGLAEWQALGFDTDSVSADPELVDPEGGDFEPAASSPCSAMGAHAP